MERKPVTVFLPEKMVERLQQMKDERGIIKGKEIELALEERWAHVGQV